MTTIAVISDTHNLHDDIIMPKADILVHCGDATMNGTENELFAFLDWFDKQDYEHKVYVPGNHDKVVEPFPNIIKQGTPANTHILIEDFVEILGLKIYGVPYVPLGPNWAYTYSRQDVGKANQIWNKIPTGLDILITHGPPMGIKDWAYGQHFGCPILRKAIAKTKPKYHLFGHIHEDQREIQDPEMTDTIFVNAALLDEQYTLTKEPFLLEI